MGGMFSENSAIKNTKKWDESEVDTRKRGALALSTTVLRQMETLGGADSERSRLSLSSLPISTVKTKYYLCVVISAKTQGD